MTEGLAVLSKTASPQRYHDNPAGIFEMSAKAYSPSVPHSNAYYLFIAVLTIISLVIMVLLLMPLDAATLKLLLFYDIVICLIFLIDFTNNLFKASSKKAYFVDDRGWLDLLGSIPSLNFLKISGLLRLARLSRLVRIVRRMRASGRQRLIRDMLRNRAQYTGVVTILLTFLVLVIASILVVQFEGRSDEANINNGLDALWWAAVTITTVGYGDHYPVTFGGRLTAVFVMLMGIGIIGVLASILSNFLAGNSGEQGDSDYNQSNQDELGDVKRELAALRELVSSIDQRLSEDKGD